MINKFKSIFRNKLTRIIFYVISLVILGFIIYTSGKSGFFIISRLSFFIFVILFILLYILLIRSKVHNYSLNSLKDFLVNLFFLLPLIASFNYFICKCFLGFKDNYINIEQNLLIDFCALILAIIFLCNSYLGFIKNLLKRYSIFLSLFVSFGVLIVVLGTLDIKKFFVFTVIYGALQFFLSDEVILHLATLYQHKSYVDNELNDKTLQKLFFIRTFVLMLYLFCLISEIIVDTSFIKWIYSFIFNQLPALLQRGFAIISIILIFVILSEILINIVKKFKMINIFNKITIESKKVKKQ